MLGRGLVHQYFDSRKLLGDVKQQRELLELPSERLPEILWKSRRRRKPTVTRAGYKIDRIRIPRVCEAFTNKSGTAQDLNSSRSSLTDKL